MNNTQRQILLFRARNDIEEFRLSLKDVAIKTTYMYHSNCTLYKGSITEELDQVDVANDMIEEIDKLEKIIKVIKDSLEGL